MIIRLIKRVFSFPTVQEKVCVQWFNYTIVYYEIFFRDKAGGYGIQAKGGTLVERVNGDYFNVMGFPLHRFSRKILEIYADHLNS